MHAASLTRRNAFATVLPSGFGACPNPSSSWGKEEYMALEINTVIVFGDSLSDIGKKWTSGVGRFARFIKQIRVNGSGRFSDCRNWTDHMFEDATGRTMVSDSDSETIKISEKFTSYSTRSVVGLNSGEGLLSRDEALGPNNAPPVNE